MRWGRVLRGASGVDTVLVEGRDLVQKAQREERDGIRLSGFWCQHLYTIPTVGFNEAKHHREGKRKPPIFEPAWYCGSGVSGARPLVGNS